MLRKAALLTAFDHFTGRPKTAYPTRYHYVEICARELADEGLTLGRIGQHGLLLTLGAVTGGSDAETRSEEGARGNRESSHGEHGRRGGADRPGLAIAVRYTTARDLRLLEAFKERGGRIAYLLDDDLWAMAADTRLDPRYRSRIARFLDGHFNALRDLADIAVAPNARLLERMAPLPGAFLHPADLAPSGDLSHFDGGGGAEEETRVLFIGTATHLADFAAVAPGLAEALAIEPSLRLSTFLGRAGAAVLPASARVTHLAPMVLDEFQPWLDRARFHVALAPYAVNPVNNGRSIIKLHQHAVAGAAGIYTPTAVFSPVVEDGVNGLIAEHGPFAFRDAVLRLARDRQAARAIAEAGIANSRRLGERGCVARFWGRIARGEA
ncbi:hypothetical protein [Stappia sp.]|uniref:hypothetical protein n=1 Tax=Stappia sp. TaxID=1870903 RepID=UPI003A9A4BD5